MKRNIFHFKEEISWKDIVGILAGSLILVIAIKWVLIPANLLTGGVLGLALILNHITALDVWVWYIILNLPLMVAGYKLVSRRFIIYSLLATSVQTILLAVLAPIDLHIDDLLLSAVLGAALGGLGIGIVFRCRGSSGGTDIIAIIVRKYWGTSIGTTVFMINIVVLSLSIIAFSIELALFSAISVFITGKVIDIVEAGPLVARTAMIISDKSDNIAQGIMDYLHRGCTYLPATGAYSGQEKRIILVILAKTQIPRLKEIVFQLDPGAFITISESIETYGQGFKSSKSDF